MGFTSRLLSTLRLSKEVQEEISTIKPVGVWEEIEKLKKTNEDIMYRFKQISNAVAGRETTTPIPSTPKAFPTAYGAGAELTGGRGGTVYHVTNLSDDGLTGSFRDAVSASNRIIVFDVSGVIEITSYLEIGADNITIAGQTAPQGGITIGGRDITFKNGSNQVIRYVRFRPEFTTAGVVDALNVSNIDGCIFDHCSVSWGGDEAFTLTGTTDNATIQNCIMGESKTAMITGIATSNTTNFSVIGNLYYNISHRFPNMACERLDKINNVVHNWFTRISVIATQPNSNFNEIGNYYQPGVKTDDFDNASTGKYAVNWMDIGSASQRAAMRVYMDDNVITGFAGSSNFADMYRVRFDVTSGSLAPLSQWAPAPAEMEVDTPFDLLGVSPTILTSSQTLASVPVEAGANKYLNDDGTYVVERDSIDTLYTGHVIADTSVTYTFGQEDIVNSAHYIAFQATVTGTPINTRAANYDTSGDGMPDTWKRDKGLNVSADDSLYDWGNGYIGCEEFLNEIDLGTEVPPLDLPSLLVELNPDSIDATAVTEDDAITEWVDVKNGFDATETTTPPQLHIEGVERQVEFVSANLDFLSIPSTNVNFVPQTDEFTIILKNSHSIDAATVSQGLVMKAQLNLSASCQYGIYTVSGTLRANVGGVDIYNNTLDPVAEEILALVVRTSGADFYRNNVKVADNIAIGTATTTNDLIIGSRYTGASWNLNGSLSHVSIYNAELTPTELTNIYNEIN